jgi:hypothetical protein
MHIGERSGQGKEDQKKKIAAQRSEYTRPMDGKLKSNLKRKKGEGKQYIPCAGKGRAMGPATTSTDGDGGDDGAHEQDANAESERREGRLQASGPI